MLGFGCLGVEGLGRALRLLLGFVGVSGFLGVKVRFGASELLLLVV